MYKGKKITAIIAAAGSGVRMGGGMSKQFRKISGLPVLVRAVGVFSEHPCVDEIYIVTKEEERELTLHMIERYGLKKVEKVVVGGKTRQESVFFGVKALKDTDFVLVHDAARPFVSSELILRTIEALADNAAVSAAVPVKDTIKVRTGDFFTATPDRESLYSVQTPQGFHFRVLKKAHEKAAEENFCGTDDTMLAERAGQKVCFVQGDYNNIKVTTFEDFIIGEAIAEKLQKKEEDRVLGEAEQVNKIRIGTGFDVHKFAEERKLILGGIEIPFDRGLLGHSDADVLLHAIMDALLGAGGLGDIGTHFPDSEPEYCGISSLYLLEKVSLILKEEDYAIGNIDATVIAQEPKIAPYLHEMRQKIASTLQIPLDCINIKGTTTEQLGFCGRGEGIAAQASAVLYRKETKEI